SGQVTLELKQLAESREDLEPFGFHCSERRFNADGFLTHSRTAQGRADTYLHPLRNGIGETVGRRGFGRHQDQTYLSPGFFEEESLAAAARYVRLATRFDLGLPYLVATSLVGVRGVLLYMEQSWPRAAHGRPIDRDNLVL